MRRIIKALGLSRRASPFFTGVHVAATLLAAAIPVAVAWLTKLVLDGVIAGADAGVVVGLGVALAVAGVAAALMPQIGQFAAKEIERRVGLLVQDRLFSATEKFVGMARFEDPEFHNRLRMALQHGGATPQVVLTSTLTVGGGVLTIGGFLGTLAVVSPWLPVLVLGSALPMLATELWLARRRASLWWRLGPVERREFFFQDLLTDTQAAKEIRLYGIGPYLRDRMLSRRRTSDRENRRMDLRQLGTQALTGVAGAAVAGGTLIWAAYAAVTGRITVGDISLLVASVAGVQSAGFALIHSIAQGHQQLLLFDHYLSVLDAGPDLPVPARPTPIAPLTGGIVFRNVWFRYTPEHPWVLRGVDLTIPSGRTVGLIGRNGAGKSTLIKLLCRMYDPERGAITWDGVDIRDIDPGELRARIGAVFQDYMEYDLTAAENIGLGDIAHMGDRDRVADAARTAGAHDFITELPRSYDTLLSRLFFVGDDENTDDENTDDENADDENTADADPDRERGVSLSGGQWQRLALARAHLRDERDLMILDEPSSGLDAEAEYRIHRTLRRRRANRTNVLISHRLNTVRHADVLIVLEDGVVAERGTHDELIAKGGIYAELFHLQAEGYHDVPVSS